MSLPKWVVNIVNETGRIAPTLKHAENVRELVKALSIAWEALEFALSGCGDFNKEPLDETKGDQQESGERLKKYMRSIKELGNNP